MPDDSTFDSVSNLMRSATRSGDPYREALVQTKLELRHAERHYRLLVEMVNVVADRDGAMKVLQEISKMGDADEMREAAREFLRGFGIEHPAWTYGEEGE